MIVDNTNCTCEELKKIYEKMGTVPPVQEVPIFLLSESDFEASVIRKPGNALQTNYYVIYAKSLSGASEVCDFHLENFADSPTWFHDGGSEDVVTISLLTSDGNGNPNDLAAFNSGWTHKIIIGVQGTNDVSDNFYGHREFTFNFVQDAGLSPELTQDLRIYQDYPVPDSYVLTADTALPSPLIVNDLTSGSVKVWPYISTKNNQPISSEIELVSLYSDYANYLTLGTESGNWDGLNERASVEWQISQVSANSAIPVFLDEYFGFDKYIQFRVKNEGLMKLVWFIFKGTKIIEYGPSPFNLYNVLISYNTTPGLDFGKIQIAYSGSSIGVTKRFSNSYFDGRYNGKHLVIGAASGYKVTAFLFVNRSGSYYLYNQSVIDSVFVAQDGQLTNFYVPDDDGTLFVLVFMQRSDGGALQVGGAGNACYYSCKFLFADYDNCPGLPSHFG
jgi:hypothetical protein